MASDFVVDVHGDQDNAELQQSDAKHTPAYKLHKKYKPPFEALNSSDRARSGKRYFSTRTEKPTRSKFYRAQGDNISNDNDSTLCFVPISNDLEEEDENEEEPWIGQNRTLNERTRLDSSDIEAWWALVQLQDEIPGCTKAARLEKKSSILAAAVKANPSSDLLWLAYIRLCNQLLSSNAVDNIWEDALASAPSPLMYESYIRSLLLSFSTFSMSNIRDQLSSIIQKFLKASRPDPLIHILSLWCWIERGAGFVERSIAICQAAIEFNIFCPKSLINLSFEGRLNEFERFWESEVPRIGELGAPTWAVWYENQDQEYTEHGGDTASVRPPSAHGFDNWFNAEAQESYNTWLPVRKVEVDDDSLLDRIVVFDDIRITLFDCNPTSYSIHLVDELLCSAGLPDFCLSRFRIVSPNDDSSSFRLSLFSSLFTPAEHPLSGPRNFPGFLPKQFSEDPPCPNATSFALAMIDKVTQRFSHEVNVQKTLQMTRLIIECHCNGLKNAAKSAKQMLKLDRSSLELCYAFSTIQSRLGNFVVSSNVYKSIVASLPSDQNKQLYCLLWMAICDGIQNKLDIRHFLVYCAEGTLPSSDISPLQMTRARKKLSNMMTSLSEDASWWVRPSSSLFPACPGLCLSLSTLHLEYLCSDISDVVSWIGNVLKPILPSSGPQLDYCWLVIVRLMQMHVASNPSCPPRLWRSILEQALESCPLSQSIWQVAMDSFKLTGAVRSVFDSCLSRLKGSGLYDAPVRPFLYAVMFEIGHPTPATTTRVHRLLEQGLAGQGRGMALLWRIYIAFELSRGDLVAAKKILYRAIAQCPWSRLVWIEGIRSILLASTESLRPFSNNDLLELVTLMGEKGIRLYTQPPLY